MYKIAVLGERDSVYAFAALGVDVFFVSDELLAEKELKRLVENGYAVIFVAEPIAALLEEKIAFYQAQSTASIVPIPGVNGNTGLGMKNLQKCVEKAVGSDIISK